MLQMIRAIREEQRCSGSGGMVKGLAILLPILLCGCVGWASYYDIAGGQPAESYEFLGPNIVVRSTSGEVDIQIRAAEYSFYEIFGAYVIPLFPFSWIWYESTPAGLLTLHLLITAECKSVQPHPQYENLRQCFESRLRVQTNGMRVEGRDGRVRPVAVEKVLLVPPPQENLPCPWGENGGFWYEVLDLGARAKDAYYVTLRFQLPPEARSEVEFSAGGIQLDGVEQSFPTTVLRKKGRLRFWHPG